MQRKNQQSKNLHSYDFLNNEKWYCPFFSKGNSVIPHEWEAKYEVNYTNHDSNISTHRLKTLAFRVLKGAKVEDNCP